MRKIATAGFVMGLLVQLGGCLSAAAPPPAPAVQTAEVTHKPPRHPKPQCTQWGKDVYGDPMCIAYAHG